MQKKQKFFFKKIIYYHLTTPRPHAVSNFGETKKAGEIHASERENTQRESSLVQRVYFARSFIYRRK